MCKKKSVEENTFRIIHDGTHGVMANNRIRFRDQLRHPGGRYPSGDAPIRCQAGPSFHVAL